ncbi:MAG: succinate--CoA ligase subunit alpha [Anaerolineae bacterium]|nr:succinate--CoA ligase subunit alpha [Anaerolineae bacterium]
MSILISDNTRVLIQGITGTEGSKLAERMIGYGTNVVSGVSPGRGGDWVLDGKIPVFDSTHSAVEVTGANCALITVPARFAKDALFECASAGIPLVICITESIPLKDMVLVRHYYEKHKIKLLGPSSPGIFSPGHSMVGAFPFNTVKTGSVGIVSRSGSLTYEVINTLDTAGIGISTVVGIGAAPIHGIGFIEVLDMMQMDAHTETIVFIGKVDSPEEIDALQYATRNILKPLVLYLYGYGHTNFIEMENIPTEYPVCRTMEEIVKAVRKPLE